MLPTSMGTIPGRQRKTVLDLSGNRTHYFRISRTMLYHLSHKDELGMVVLLSAMTFLNKLASMPEG